MPQKIREVMTDEIRTAPADSTLVDAAQMMKRDDIGDVIVVKEDGSLCGILTDRDIVVRALAEGRDANTTRIDDICSHDVVSVSPDTSISETARLMAERAVRRLPVTPRGRRSWAWCPSATWPSSAIPIRRSPTSALRRATARTPPGTTVHRRLQPGGGLRRPDRSDARRAEAQARAVLETLQDSVSFGNVADTIRALPADLASTRKT